MAKHEHRWVLKVTYLDPITRNIRGQIFFCVGCREGKFRINVEQLILEADRKNNPESIVQKPMESI